MYSKTRSAMEYYVLIFNPTFLNVGSSSFFLLPSSFVNYSNILSADFHVSSIVEMRRVASEVRVFPLVTQFNGETSPHLEPVINQLTARGLQVELRKVNYEFQKGGNQMLWVR